VNQSRTSAFHLAGMLIAYAKKDTKAFNEELSQYHKWLDEKYPDEMRKVRFETFYNHFDPLYRCKWVYMFAGVLALLSWLVWWPPLRSAALWLAVVSVAVHTFGLFARMYLQDRPLVFVTNLYSSAIFISWGCVVIGLVLERIYPLGVGSLVAAVLGASILHLAPSLTTGDSLEMMQAVLDTNFWLATHVTIITFGYVAMFVAGHLGWAFILLGLCTPYLRQELFQALSKMIYGVLCFATLLSFVGTVLGGIWADQSWGRFWGWDPKENGALLIVLWSALILHARWGGMVKQRGMAVLAVAGNIVTAWSWFGVNMLGVGLHSYGFQSGLFWVLSAYVPLNLMIIGAGLLPQKYWWSFRPHSLVPLSPAPR
jgi:ABC-type transport system involved in cytochrome c biogenesis permease subunit